MKTRYSHSLPAAPRPWSRHDWSLLLLLVAAGAALLLSGLSIRSLWGSEGRWAVIVREMLSSGNYFLPTINGEVYFDKPLLSYWIIALFALPGGVTEAVTRLPSALAGIAVVLLTFSTGRRLFSVKTGLLSGALLLTSVMFVLWSRTASAEVLNVLSIWLMLWAFVTGGMDGKLGKLIFLYCLGAASAFLKGPVAPAVGLSVIGFYSLVRFLMPFAVERPSFRDVGGSFRTHFKWIVSWQGLVSVAAALVLFSGLLLLPVMVTGSWQSVELMWRENVLRFLKPFDHVEPPYAYLGYAPQFFLPWTLLLFSALWQAKDWQTNWPNRWILLAGLAIFLFFTASGSRRSYYILPLIPALALITGRTLSEWLAKPAGEGSRAVRAALFATSLFPGFAGIALIASWFMKGIPHHPVQFVVGIFATAGSGAAVALLFKERRVHCVALLFALVFAVEIWGFTGGMAALEEMRTFRPFCRDAAAALKSVPDNRIALFPGGDSSLVFYLNRDRLKTLADAAEVVKFGQETPGGFLIAESKQVESLREQPGLRGLTVVAAQAKEPYGKRDKGLLLVKFGAE